MINRSPKSQHSIQNYQRRGFRDFIPVAWRVSNVRSSGRILTTLRKLTTRLGLLGVALLLLGCREQIVHDLTENDANRLLTKLHDVQIEASKEKQPDGRYALTVERDEVVQALKFLDDARIFREPKAAVTNKGGLISSREDQRFHFERSLSREIEMTLLSLDAVLEARVHLNLPPTDPLFGHPIDRSPGSASVLLVVRPTFAIAEDGIAGLVSGASGIKKEVISVILSRAIEREDVGAALRPNEEKLGDGVISAAAKEHALSAPPQSLSWWSRISLVEWLSAALIFGIGLTLVLVRQRRRRLQGMVRKFEEIAPESAPKNGFGVTGGVPDQRDSIQMIESLPGGARR